MVKDKLSEGPKTLNRIGNETWDEFLEGFSKRLEKLGYANSTIQFHLSRLSRLRDLKDGGKVNVGKIHALLDSKAAKDTYRKGWSSIRHFIKYYKEYNIVELNQAERDELYRPLLDQYQEWISQYNKMDVSTIKQRRNSLADFLKWLGPEATPEGMSRLKAETVENFFLDYSKGKKLSPKRLMQSALRTFFRFCLHRGYLRHPLDGAVPILRKYKLANLPRGLSDIQAQEVLNSIDRTTNVGRRDYAICQMLYTYGVRGSQIRNLRLDDIHWADNQILFRASKRGKDTLLPLTNKVGESILDYLKQSRPSFSYPQVFLTCRAPYNPLLTPTSMTSMVRSRFKAAGIKTPTRGTHSFRHCFATRMLGQGYSLKEIADVLGHRSIQTTFIYTKVDFKSLKEVALEWPEEVRS